MTIEWTYSKRESSLPAYDRHILPFNNFALNFRFRTNKNNYMVANGLMGHYQGCCKLNSFQDNGKIALILYMYNKLASVEITIKPVVLFWLLLLLLLLLFLATIVCYRLYKRLLLHHTSPNHQHHIFSYN